MNKPIQESFELRNINLNKLRKILYTGNSYSKKELANLSNLSLPSVNTLLNVLEENKEVLGKKIPNKEKGRDTTFYHLNEDYAYIIALYFELIDEKRVLTYSIFNLLGKSRISKIELDKLDYEAIEDKIEELITEFPNAANLVIGSPSIVENGIITHSDITELEGCKIVDRLTYRFHLPVYIDNDMHLKAYGYYFSKGNKDEIVTLLNYPIGVLPGSVTIHKGEIIKGSNLFAGMVGFLPYGVSRESQISQLKLDTALPFIVDAIISIIAIINPSYILLTGSCIKEIDIPSIKEWVLGYIPIEFLPNFNYVESLDYYYLEGLYQKGISMYLGEI